MHSRTWKKAEGRVAQLFGARRRTGSGCDPRTGADDIVHPTIFVEVRCRQKFEVLRWWKEDAKGPAETEGKLPVLVIFAAGDQTPFIVAPLDREYLLKVAAEMEDDSEVPVV